MPKLSTQEYNGTVYDNDAVFEAVKRHFGIGGYTAESFQEALCKLDGALRAAESRRIYTPEQQKVDYHTFVATGKVPDWFLRGYKSLKIKIPA